jgi:sensor histidine kinase YesM
MHRDIDAADSMLARLSDLLRLTLDRVSTQLVPLKDELDFVHKYLEIERTRFGDRLQVSFVVEPETLAAPVPNFLLQPLVENALRHGIGPKVGGGRVEVRAHRNGGWLQLVVEDDGYGVPPDRLDAFNGGVGLTNTRSRLEHLYQDNHTFDFQTPPGGGLAVTIVIPFTGAGASVVDAEVLEESRSVA